MRGWYVWFRQASEADFGVPLLSSRCHSVGTPAGQCIETWDYSASRQRHDVACLHQSVRQVATVETNKIMAKARASGNISA